MSAVARLRKPANVALTDRAQAAAQQAGLGSWERSFGINHHHDAVWMITGMVITFVAPWPFIGAGLVLHGSWWDKALPMGVGLAALAFGLLMLMGVAIKKRTGIGIAHFFEAGLVLERTKGEILASPYEGLRAEFLTWTESTNDAPRTRTRLWMTMPLHNIVAIDVGNDLEEKNASWMAQRLGLPRTPCMIEERLDETPMW